MADQLELSKEKFLQLGFVKEIITKNTFEGERYDEVIFSISSINGRFYCNVNQPHYKWYYETSIGNSSNYIHLDITSKVQLLSLLQTFRIRFEVNLALF